METTKSNREALGLQARPHSQITQLGTTFRVLLIAIMTSACVPQIRNEKSRQPVSTSPAIVNIDQQFWHDMDAPEDETMRESQVKDESLYFPPALSPTGPAPILNFEIPEEIPAIEEIPESVSEPTVEEFTLNTFEFQAKTEAAIDANEKSLSVSPIQSSGQVKPAVKNPQQLDKIELFFEKYKNYDFSYPLSIVGIIVFLAAFFKLTFSMQARHHKFLMEALNETKNTKP